MVKSIFLIFGHKAPKTEPKKGENFFGPTLTSFLRKIHLKIGFFWSGFSQKPVFLFSWNSKLKLSRVHILTPQELGPPFWLIWSGQEISWWPFFIFGILEASLKQFSCLCIPSYLGGTNTQVLLAKGSSYLNQLCQRQWCFIEFFKSRPDNLLMI